MLAVLLATLEGFREELPEETENSSVRPLGAVGSSAAEAEDDEAVLPSTTPDEEEEESNTLLMTEDFAESVEVELSSMRKDHAS